MCIRIMASHAHHQSARLPFQPNTARDAMAYARKIQKSAGKTPTELETTIAQALLELEATDLRAQLGELFISGAKEIDVAGRKAIVVEVPFAMQRPFQRIQERLVRELEKKFSKHVLFLAQRRILAKPTRKTQQKQLRPRR